MIDLKTRALAIAGSLALLMIVIDLVRRRKLKEEYSFLWVLASTSLLVLAAWYQLLEWITHVIGGVALSTTLFFFALLFVFFMLLHYSVRISALERRLTSLVQEVGLLGPDAEAGDRPPEPELGVPSISVLIPCFNDGATLEAAVQSVSEPGPVEIVIVDDGSDDEETVAALARCAEAPGVRLVRQENGGLGAARTRALQEASGEFVFPLDADDLLEPEALTMMATTLQRSPELDFTWGNYSLFGAEDGQYRAPDRWLPWTLTYVNPYPVCSMFRRQAVQSAGGWVGRAYEDWNLWLRLAGLGMRGAKTPAVVYRRRIHGDGRLLPQARRQHAALYAAIRSQNAGVFAERDRLRGIERPAPWKRAVYPLLFGSRRFVPERVETTLKRRMMRRGTGLP
ncbi:MAG: DUF2304 family protein [Baekduia sp.]